MSNKIRPYGPGKFSTILDAYVYDVSCSGGTEDEAGTTETGRWYGIMRGGRSIFKDHDPFLESLNDAERNQLESCAGVIISEDSQGFVDVDYYDTAEQLESAWAEIEEAEQRDEQD